MPETERAETYAAIDLGSNSFHLLVSRREHGELRVLDRIKEMVRLGGGLDKSGRLDPVTQRNALDCLARFGQRLRGIPADNMRAVGTWTFRRMKNANAFLLAAEASLGCSIDIIAGREEARLIYLGVSQGVSGHEDRKLVIDIGGGSTEMIIGQGPETLQLESVQFGCVSLTKRFFANGKISRKRWNKGMDAVMAELQELRLRYLATGWQTAIGSSGTVLAISEICHQAGLGETDIDRASLEKIRAQLLQFKNTNAVQFPGLSEQRQPVLAGGLLMLCACFETFELQKLRTSPYALREGLLYDMLGRLQHRDPRENTVLAFKRRHGVDEHQAERVKATVATLFTQMAADCGLRPIHQQILDWAADLHEVGLSVSHSHYPEHSGYLVQQSDMPGFTTTEQQFIAALVRNHRRVIVGDFTQALPTRVHHALRQCLLCLRLACIFCRSRDSSTIPHLGIKVSPKSFTLLLAEDWMRSHPLTMHNLQTEALELRPTGIVLRVEAIKGMTTNARHDQ
ncbi:MAG: Ppx/GppA phosphatase family protein [Xanthomonadales bacterium]|nr:Ppx/GppA phosphatase family protein [Xanthomonadales bacterium]